MSQAGKPREEPLVADNRKAGHDYHLLEQFEAGLVLVGTEVKAAREGRVNLREAYCRLEGGEAYLLGAHIGQYSHGGYASHDPTRRRKLLLNQSELNKLLGKTTEKGLTIVPLRMYFKKGRHQAGHRAGQGQEAVRQTGNDQAPRRGTRDARGRQDAAGPPGIIAVICAVTPATSSAATAVTVPLLDLTAQYAPIRDETAGGDHPRLRQPALHPRPGSRGARIGVRGHARRGRTPSRCRRAPTRCSPC